VNRASARPVEFKTLDAPTGLNGIRNNLQSSENGTGQSDEIVIDTRESQAPDMTKAKVDQQLQQYFSGARSKTNGNVQRVTVILPDGTTTTWPPGYGGL
jgi:hypothetical protein